MPVFEFDSGDDNLGGETRAWKAKEGESYLMSVLWWPGSEEGTPNLSAKSPKFSGSQRHFKNGVGYFLNKGPEYTKIAGGKPSQAIVTLVALWPINSKGQLDKARVLEKDYEVKPWVFSKAKYTVLKTRHAEFPLGQHDLKITCTDTQYQTLDISPSKNCLFRQLQETEDAALQAIYKDITNKVQLMLPDIDSHMGRDIPLDELREAFGLAVSAPSAGLTSDVEIDDLLDDLG